MKRLQLLSATFNIRPGEGRLVGLMLIYALLMGIPGIVTETTAYSLLLAEFGANIIPYIYIGFALVATSIGFIYTSLEERLSFSKFLTLSLSILLVTLVLLRLLLGLSQGRWPLIVLAIWSDTMWVLLGLAFWALVSRLFNVRQGKRLFGLIGAGLIISEIITGFLIPLMVRLIGISNLLLVAMIGLTGALIVQIYIMRSFAGQLSGPDEEASAADESEKSIFNLLQSRYIVMIFALAALTYIAYYFLDNIFYAQAEAHYPTGDQLASFFGIFFALSGSLDAFLSVFVSGRLLNRYGLRISLLVMPVMIILGTTSVILLRTASPGLATLFWLVTITKILNEALKSPINGAASRILYQPLPADQRLQAQTAVEGIVEPLAGGLAGLMLLLSNTLLMFDALQLAYLLLLILVAAIGVVIKVSQAYPAMLIQALAERRLSSEAVFAKDHSTIAILKQGLASPHLGVVLYALDILTEIAPASLPDLLPGLLEHPEREVRLDVLRRIEQLGLTDAVPIIRARISHEGSRSVQAASWRVLAALGGPELFDEIIPHLEDPDPQIRQEVLVGLLRSSELEGILAAGEKLIAGVNSLDPAERALAARVLGEGGILGFYRPLLRLLQDDQPQVQQAALIAAGKLKQPKLWPSVIQKLASPQVYSTALPVLVAGGEEVLPDIKSAFGQQGGDRTMLIRLARICGRIGGPEAIALLQDHLDFPDERVRTEVLQALSRCGYQAGAGEKSLIQQQIKLEAAQAAWTLAALVNTDDAGPNVQVGDKAILLLKTALNNNLARHRARLFLWLSFIYEPQSILRARDILNLTREGGNESRQQRAYALEIIDVSISTELKVMLLPLLDDLGPRQRLQRLSSLFPPLGLSRNQYLQAIITGPDTWLTPWSKVCALYAVGQLEIVELSGTVIEALSAPDPLVRETAVWTLASLDVALYRRYAPALSHDSAPQVVKAMRALETTPSGDRPGLMLVEKAIHLKTAAFFAQTPEEVLADIAAVLEEVTVQAGEVILAKGATASSMYLIVSGQVCLHDGPRTIATLEQNDVFGELALLSSGPEPFAATALTGAHLLRLDQEPFYELLEDHSQIAHQIMQHLARRLQRAAGQGKADRIRDDLLGGLREKLTPPA